MLKQGNGKHRNNKLQMANSSPTSKEPASEPTLASTNNPPAFKRDIACSPGTVREFFLIFFLGCSRKILGVRAEHKLAIYLVFVFLGSILSELFTMPKDIALQRFARPLNTFVIRFGYGWVLILTFPLILLTSRVYSHNNNVTTFANFGRLVFNTFAWFIATSVFFWYYSAKGICVSMSQSNETHTTLKNLIFNDCKKSGFQWSGFDISGHTFLLIFCNLILLEEASSKLMKMVDKCLQQQNLPPSNSVSSVQTSTPQQVYGIGDEVAPNNGNGGPISKREKQILQGVVCLCAMTSVAYDYLLFMTVLYHHTILEKMLAFLVASVCWYGLYRLIYPKMTIQPGANSGQQHNL